MVALRSFISEMVSTDPQQVAVQRLLSPSVQCVHESVLEEDAEN